jgi:cytochrome c oxidase subunit II
MLNSNRPNAFAGNSILWIVVAGAAILFGGIIIGGFTSQLFPPQASAEAQQIDGLFQIMLAIGGAVFLLVQGLLVYSIIRFRAKADDKSDGLPLYGNAMLETVWTAIPAVIVVVLSILSYQVWVTTRAAKPDEMQAIALGQRFAWTFQYEVPEEDIPADVPQETIPVGIQQQLDEKGSFTINSTELHTYVGRPVHMLLNTMDAQHAFWIPAMRIKQDLLTGRQTDIRFTPVLAGEYPVVCAELCGSGHGQMRATVIVHESEEAYLNDFYIPTLTVAVVPPEDPVARGELVLAGGAYPCSGCHVLDALGWQGVTGPNLNGVGDRAADARSVATGLTPEEYLHRSLYHPHEYLVPGYGPVMPQFQPNDPAAPNYMPESDNEAITAYLCNETATGENVCDLENLAAIIEAEAP